MFLCIWQALRLPGAVCPNVLRNSSFRITLAVSEVVGIENQVKNLDKTLSLLIISVQSLAKTFC